VNAILRRPQARVGLLYLALLVLVAVFSDLIASSAPIVMSKHGHVSVLPAVTAPASVQGRNAAAIAASLGPDDWAVWAPIRADERSIGTRRITSSRDAIALTVRAARNEVILVFAVVLIALLGGTLLGAFAGYASPFVDAILARLVELGGAMPTLVLLAIALGTHRLPPLLAFVLVLGLLRAIRTARLVRGEVLRVSGQEFVMAARALGTPPGRLLETQILPHALGPALVSAAFTGAAVVGLESALALAGLESPGFASWGTLLASGSSAGVLLWPALAVLLTTGAFYGLAEACDEALSVRRRRAAEADHRSGSASRLRRAAG